VANVLDEQNQKQLRRVVRAHALHLQEQAARSEQDFWELVKSYDKLDALCERKERYREKLSTENFIEWQLWSNETVIPRPLNHEWWRQILGGNFLDVIFDCPHEIEHLASSPSIHEPLKSLSDERKEILYYRAIRQWSPQRLAMFRGQTDRNIRKVYETALRQIRERLYARLSPRYKQDLPLTLEQREFCKNYKAALDGGTEYDDILKKLRTNRNVLPVDVGDIDDSVPDDCDMSDIDGNDDFDENRYLKPIHDERYYDTFHFDDGEFFDETE
jgi:hypothetical protein